MTDCRILQPVISYAVNMAEDHRAKLRLNFKNSFGHSSNQLEETFTELFSKIKCTASELLGTYRDRSVNVLKQN